MTFRFRRLLPFVFSLIAAESFAMTFSAPKHEFIDVFSWENLHSGSTRIYADGEITSTTVEQFNNFVKARKIDSATVLFNSGGGSLLDGIHLGSAIRALGFNTGIATFSKGKMVEQGTCASACAYAFAGGVGRNFVGNGTRLGIHQFFSQSGNVSAEASQQMSGVIVGYLQKMGVDTFAFSAASFVGKDTILWLTVADAEKLRFANNGVYPTTAELKQAGKDTYLKIEQWRLNGSARLLFFCENRRITLNGGLITTEEDVKNKNDWATRTFFNFDNSTIQPQLRADNPNGFSTRGSVAWVSRALSATDLNKLMSSNEVTVGIGGDGAMAYVGKADLRKVKDKLESFLDNCVK